MAIEMAWDDADKTIFMMTVEGEWTLDDYYPKYLEAKVLMEEQPHPVTLLIDMQQTNTLPRNILSTASFNRKARANNLVFTAMIGAPRIVQVFVDAMTRLISSSGKFAFAKTLEDARAMAQERLVAASQTTA
jgi:hypothetical protein